jgi:hypothetical protein
MKSSYRGLKEMRIDSLLKWGIYEIRFGYNTNLGGSTTLMSDILLLAEMCPRKTKETKLYRGLP